MRCNVTSCLKADDKNFPVGVVNKGRRREEKSRAKAAETGLRNGRCFISGPWDVERTNGDRH